MLYLTKNELKDTLKGDYGLMTVERKGADDFRNMKAHKEFKQLLDRCNISYMPVTGVWDSETEQSYLILADRGRLLKLADICLNKYDQDAVIVSNRLIPKKQSDSFNFIDVQYGTSKGNRTIAECKDGIEGFSLVA